MSEALQRVVSAHYVLLHCARRLRVPAAVQRHAHWAAFCAAVTVHARGGRDDHSWAAALSELSDRQLFNMALHIAALPMELPRPAQQFLCMHYFLLSLTRVLEAGSIDSLDDDYEEWDHWCDVVVRAARGDADVVAWTALVERLSEAELALYAAELVVKHNTKLFDA
jgi:hypothetical protein